MEDVEGGRANSEVDVGSAGLAAMVRETLGSSGMLSSDTGWAERAEEDKGVGGGKRSWGNGAGDSSSTIDYGRSRPVQLASPGLLPNRAEDRATQLPVPTNCCAKADADRDLLRRADMRPRLFGDGVAGRRGAPVPTTHIKQVGPPPVVATMLITTKGCTK